MYSEVQYNNASRGTLEYGQMEDKTVQVTGYVLADLYAKFAELAKADRRSISYMVTDAVREYVSRHGGAAGLLPATTQVDLEDAIAATSRVAPSKRSPKRK